MTPTLPSPGPTPPLPARIADWLAGRGWQLLPHQAAMLAVSGPGSGGAAPDGAASTLLIAPTGAGKTLAGFLPSLIDLCETPRAGLHTLYISPLRALAADMARNLDQPVAQMGLPIRIEARTGDTPQSRRRRQRIDPPHILLSTPESLAVMLSQPEAAQTFAPLKRVIVDEVHALAGTLRGDQLALCLARLRRLAPGLRVVGLSASVGAPQAIADYLDPAGTQILRAEAAPPPDLGILPAPPAPWAGGGGRHAVAAVLAAIRAHRQVIVFHNTRAQAELFFHALWLANDDNLPIALHHGSLDRATREKVEAAMAAGRLRAVVATGSLDLGLDWGAVDLVIQIGAPKNVKRLVQRIGRAGHRPDHVPKARLVPANRFEAIECHAALRAVAAGLLEPEPPRPGAREVLCQHILMTACAGPFDADALLAEARAAGPYVDLSRAEFDDCLSFCATGGYALRAYDRWQRLVCRDGLWRLRDPRSARDIRMNLGTITGREMTRVRARRGPDLGEIEEAFAATLRPGEHFLIGGQVVRFDALRETVAEVTPAPGRIPRIAVYSGGKFSTSATLCAEVAALLADPAPLDPDSRDWIALQGARSGLPGMGRLLIETFPLDGRPHLAVWGLAGRNAQQTLGLLLTQRMEEAGLGPLGFVASDHATLVWSVDPAPDPAALLSAQGLRAGLEGWLRGNALMKRTFRDVATVAGLLAPNRPGARKSGRQATFSSDILYDTLARHEPDHLMLRLTRVAAMRGLIDFERLEEMLARVAGRIEHRALDRLPPLIAPLLLEAGRVPIEGAGRARLEAAEAARLMAEAGLEENGLGEGGLGDRVPGKTGQA
ncbi:ligase-associated DNA damage response DEXH box helicase [Phaeovulum vinaykumarii]|uniref:ATP-dependent helicase Lhr and Lhr-like helicase n=1 Tax=Phaeovulum vinaykumarii TaxID=407234 RepID=A0A1N7K3G5_9RHOB|nr:ligase-associated DNA damage response DEXH box helicase [Phaeovulum vinaykumarii]SIS56109.1 ATP-dependent helicase Lhr and Lhr-like helicase [Phaeovulum vinaykumarii]SOB92714.1 ATP-dependent Lhr-like helicase [Phaeovulum vinaykumarii]